MSDQTKTDTAGRRNQRLAAALRENLKRRKAQAKRRAAAGLAERAAEPHDSAGIGDDKRGGLSGDAK